MSKNVCMNAATASHKFTLRLETQPLHILLRILDQETVITISNHSQFTQQDTSQKLTYTTKA
jgi:hypothetical protein